MADAVSPRVLLVTRNLPPLVGGMERLNWHMAEQLAEFAPVRVVAPKGSAALAPSGVRVDEAPLRPLWWFLVMATLRSLYRALSWRPTVVLAGSGLAAPLAWAAARLAGARAYVYVHGLDLAVTHPLYRLLWHPFLRRMDGVIANSRATAALARDIGVDAARISVVPPGVTMPPEDESPDGSTAFRQQYGLEERRVLLSVGRLSTRKGLLQFVSDVLPAIVAEVPGAMLVVVGDAPADALHAKAQSREAIQSAAEAAGVAGHLLFLGVITDRDRLSDAYRASDIHVFPVRELPGDPEGFGMVAIEAAAHGLPTVAYATGGVVDAVADGVSGVLVKAGDAPSFARAVDSMLRHPLPAGPMRAFARDFAWDRFAGRLKVALTQVSTGEDVR